jgi:DNA-binding response OmpR family regulator
VVAEDGEKAIHYLLRKEEFQSVKSPDLIILDLNLPKRDGSEVLGTIRSDANLSRLPVIILSSSPEDVVRDQVKTTAAKPDWIFTKPVGAPEFLALGRKFRECFRQAAERRVSPEFIPAVPTPTS